MHINIIIINNNKINYTHIIKLLLTLLLNYY